MLISMWYEDFRRKLMMHRLLRNRFWFDISIIDTMVFFRLLALYWFQSILTFFREKQTISNHYCQIHQYYLKTEPDNFISVFHLHYCVSFLLQFHVSICCFCINIQTKFTYIWFPVVCVYNNFFIFSIDHICRWIECACK